MKPLSTILLVLLVFHVNAQRQREALQTEWPPEYKWQVAKRTSSQVYIIPGYEQVNSATIIGVIAAESGVRLSTVDTIVAYYRNQLDTGSILTVLDRSQDPTHLWVLFKVETPKTEKYPEPEADLYYVAQGDYALFDTHVAIKAPALTDTFITKWSAVLKASRIAKQ